MHESTLRGKTALVTGGGTGIGQGVALALAEAGARVAITYNSHQPDSAFARRVESSSGKPLKALQVDATSEEIVGEAVEEIASNFGGLDILVNNVGGLVQRSTIMDMEYSLWRQVMGVNLDATFLMTRAVLPHLRRNGRIINVASLAGRNGGHAGATAYATSKAAIFGFTRGLAKEVAESGITVNALAPGFIEATPFHDTFTTSESKAATVAGIPLGRAGLPEDVAGAALWLASDHSRFVTGTVVDINGGQYFA
ncbi:SDR family NAD(P)-dependent oxidoreductase [Arthrobacter sp. MMS18-M83]|uniref:SDR family NAD(P)-dependent oxidoreductase n=1 Tax=Arthrobacter sp. MMS18-M83 TaxID=2996261 RepID=UPI00227C7557|nr:SDR family NAD(P)-dependent oxidoreductase [Arthrobacter sp. MMS18-M83]WAH95407.1 SDR family NAD(P)-dependent oxidoreductase [Arthrobacter sp. MMS18-M83]